MRFLVQNELIPVQQKNIYIKLETFKHTIGLLQGIPIRKICLYLENEPLLDHNFFKHIREINERLFFGNLEISTNVSLLNETNIKLLNKAVKGLNHEIWLSWHGITPESYKQLMGFDFNVNLVKLKNYFKITQGKINTVINSIIGNKLESKNYSGKDETIAFFKNIIKECGIDDFSKIRFNLFYHHDRAGNIGAGKVLDKHLQELVGRLKPDCKRIKEWLHILYDGDVILCCMDYHKETVMGNINNFETLESFLTSSKYRQIYNKSIGKIKTDSDYICKRCLSPGG